VKYLAALCSSARALMIAAIAGGPVGAPPPAHAQTGADREAAEWNTTLGIGTAAAYQRYLEHYPVGAHAGDAFRRMIELTVDPEAGHAGPGAGSAGGHRSTRGLAVDMY
jgi:hypothetical protein